MNKKITSITAVMILSFSLTISPFSDNLTENPVTASAKAHKVYYVPGSSYAYHCTKHCYTLARSRVIKGITVKKARKKGLRPCKVCYR